ncbi:hypothetical protein BH11PSE2_BH11PSE2_17240 [soil metagenome]
MARTPITRILDRDRAEFGIMAAIGVASMLTAIYVAWEFSSTPLMVGDDATPLHVARYAAIMFAKVLPVAMFGWATGLMIVGGPVWWVAHRLGARSWLFAVVLGAALPAPFVYLALNLRASVGFAVIGAVAGLGPGLDLPG